MGVFGGEGDECGQNTSSEILRELKLAFKRKESSLYWQQGPLHSANGTVT